MNSKMGKYAGDKLFHAISLDNDPTILHFMFHPHHKVETTHILNGLQCILAEELPVNSKEFITR